MKALASEALFTPKKDVVSRHKYEQIPSEYQDEEAKRRHPDLETSARQRRNFWANIANSKRRLMIMSLSVVGILTFLVLAIGGYGKNTPHSCDDVHKGYKCSPEISRFWGQYSPYFSVPSEISTDVPPGCSITLVQALSRHGARDPTLGKTIKYSELIKRIHEKAISYSKEYAFLRDYNYTIGADQLSAFGQQEMINSGEDFYRRYKHLARENMPFIRSAGQDRVVESAQNWTQGFHRTKAADKKSSSDDSYPYNVLIIPESDNSNNTLSHDTCPAFSSAIGGTAQGIFMNKFSPPITKRLNQGIPGMNFSDDDTVSMMDLCPFETVASTLGHISRFCSLFTESEWHSYDYYQSLGKYYGYGTGSSLGATQGVGFANELIARLTNTPVSDHTNTNTTLDSDPLTFPLGGDIVLFADFSHDNDMMGTYTALGLYNATRPLSNTTVENTDMTKGFAASWAVPFAGRAYFEKMSCRGRMEESVRVIVNDRVLPLETCGGDKFGLCKLSRFVESLSFARAGGRWDECFE